MKMSSISGVVCHVKDLDETAAFYEKLGFRLKREPAQLTAYVNWFWITFRPQEDGAVTHAGSHLYIKVEDIQAFYDGVQELGLKPTTAPAKRSGMIEFELPDPDGYTLVFFWKK
ncbi:VOC family protein [Dactylosporangium sp. NPDC005555]|uniref:VOC family protein n=1 Tax=Dactylosporangium sp. NPDC005555 TaxID=3154889 RepID=UPI0033AAF816